jgi:hypothetical protein
VYFASAMRFEKVDWRPLLCAISSPCVSGIAKYSISVCLQLEIKNGTFSDRQSDNFLAVVLPLPAGG